MTQAEMPDQETDSSVNDDDETESGIPQNYQLPDFGIKAVGDDERALVQLNEFFNQPTLKSELHWFTHRETLERAATREDRRLFYIAPRGRYLAGLMIWCESRVLTADEAQIRLVAVSPLCRNHGLGRALVKEAVEFARYHSKSTVIADVAAESPAVGFWRQCGFSEREQYETNSGRIMRRMERSL
jgi:ribosomal protein S18 acetylase RimI-like enzyme